MLLSGCSGDFGAFSLLVKHLPDIEIEEDKFDKMLELRKKMEAEIR